MRASDNSPPQRAEDPVAKPAPLRRSRRGRALPALALAILGLVIVLALRGALSATTLLFPAVLFAAAAWVAHFLSQERR